jgi:hypothetical protein
MFFGYSLAPYPFVIVFQSLWTTCFAENLWTIEWNSNVLTMLDK